MRGFLVRVEGSSDPRTFPVIFPLAQLRQIVLHCERAGEEQSGGIAKSVKTVSAAVSRDHRLNGTFSHRPQVRSFTTSSILPSG